MKDTHARIFLPGAPGVRGAVRRGVLQRYGAIALLAACAGFGSCALAWIDYSDRVPPKEPAFGKEFDGFALKIETEKTDFEQDEPVRLTLTLRNSNNRSRLIPAERWGEHRFVRLYLVLATKNGNSLFSRDLMPKAKDAGFDPLRLSPGEQVILSVPFNSLQFAHISEFEHGLPSVSGRTRYVPVPELVPQLFVLKGLLVSGIEGRRPDFVVASYAWPILLRPVSGAKLSDPVKQRKLQQYLQRLREGAYGGMAVSSQLAALGDLAVDPLIQIAERPGPGKTFESRVWAIVTLCNIRSPKASAYILEKLRHPVALSDLNFLAWHSQACRSPEIEAELDRLVNAILKNEPLPWQDRFRTIPRGVKSGFLEFTFKHYASIKRTISDATVRALLRWPDPKPVGFGLAVWKPQTPESAVSLLTPLFAKPDLHPNLRRPILKILSDALRTQGFPQYDRTADMDAQWHRAGLWLAAHDERFRKQEVAFLRAEVFSVRNEEVKRDVIAALRRALGERFPVRTSVPAMPEDWVRTWRWALHAGPIDAEFAVRFLCNQMRSKTPPPDVVRRALLEELRTFIGPRFPYAPGKQKDIDEAWVTCGNWLIKQGYFGRQK